jgi:hypothetical protein
MDDERHPRLSGVQLMGKWMDSKCGWMGMDEDLWMEASSMPALQPDCSRKWTLGTRPNRPRQTKRRARTGR